MTDPKDIKAITENTNLHKSDDLDQKEQFLKKHKLNFPGGPTVKNPPANAGDMRSTGKTPHHGATKPTCRNFWACALEPLCPRETRKSPHAATKAQQTQTKQYKFKRNKQKHKQLNKHKTGDMNGPIIPRKLNSYFKNS